METPEASYHDKLRELAYNLWWTWHPEVVSIFRDLDPELWRDVNHNPVLFLKRTDPEELDRRARDVALESRIHDTVNRLNAYLAPRAPALRMASKLRIWPVAYFSAEFGLHECLPTYAGGLGILAGDHLKSTSDLGVPLQGVGLLYAEGYFRQHIDKEGWQKENYPTVQIEDLPISPVMDLNGNRLFVEISLPDRSVQLQLWEAQVGRTSLCLLDSNVPQNKPDDRKLTGRLYAADAKIRLLQEIVLGIGGVRALAAMQRMPGVVHLNEGHSALALLEMIRLQMVWEGVPFERARDHVARRTVFTTHTPVPAGHDHFAPGLFFEYVQFMCKELGLGEKELLALGRVDPEDKSEPFCMTVLALKVSHRANGVSALHGRISRRMWRPLWGMRAEQEIPIGHITNGVHVQSWIAPDMYHLFERYLGHNWTERMAEPSAWDRLTEVRDEELWGTHELLKGHLINFARRRVAQQRLRRGEPQKRIAEAQKLLDPRALTIGFARRFASYKRPALLFDDMDRLLRIMSDPNKPVQCIFAGKAHPADELGKRIIQKVVEYSEDPRLAGRLVFIEDYDISVGRHLVQGVDLWLNNPQRPLEACGTSGQKVVFNGGLNLSILDGWWSEAYDGNNGFALGYGGSHPDSKEQRRRDAEHLYNALEYEVIPMFFNRPGGQVPIEWVARMKWALFTLGWRFNSDRMVWDYFNECYLPAAGASSFSRITVQYPTSS